jgi:hypothetical protein
VLREAGEKQVAPTSRTARGVSKSNHRSHRSISSVSLTNASTSARATPNAPFSATTGPGSRPPTTQGFSRSQAVCSNSSQPGSSAPRPNTSFNTRNKDLPETVLGKRKGKQLSYLSSHPLSPLAFHCPLKNGHDEKHIRLVKMRRCGSRTN